MSFKTPSNKSAASGSKATDNTTPSSRLYDPKIPNLSEKAKDRVRDQDVNNNRCLIENCDEVRIVQFAHVVPKALGEDDELMTKVEWYWNMPYRGLHVNTRFNVFRLGSSVHGMFDKFLWVLVPEENVVKKYHASLIDTGDKWTSRRQTFPQIPDSKEHKYQLIPISKAMSKVALTRQNEHKDTPVPNQFIVHTYPFDTLPEITSHIHPKFAIFEAGYALVELGTIGSNTAIAQFPILSDILQIYEAWTTPLPSEAAGFKLPESPDDNDDRSDKDSTYTERRPIYKPKRKGKGTKRSLPKGPETPTPASKTQKVESGKGKSRQQHLKRRPSLTTYTLEIHTREVGEEEGWSNKAIQAWSNMCRPLPKVHLHSALRHMKSCQVSV